MWIVERIRTSVFFFVVRLKPPSQILLIIFILCFLVADHLIFLCMLCNLPMLGTSKRTTQQHPIAVSTGNRMAVAESYSFGNFLQKPWKHFDWSREINWAQSTNRGKKGKKKKKKAWWEFHSCDYTKTVGAWQSMKLSVKLLLVSLGPCVLQFW